QSMKVPGETRSLGTPNAEKSSQSIARRSGFGYGSGRITVRSSTVKRDEFPPIPRARITVTESVNPGALSMARTECRRSQRRVSILTDLDDLEGTGLAR